MSGDAQQTLGALLARLEVRERQIAVEAEAAHEQMVQLTALLDGLAQAAEHIAITRKTLLELTAEAPLAPAEPAASLPDGPAYQQIMAVFAEADAPLRARNVCEAMDLNLAPEQHQQRPHQTEALDQARNPGRNRAGTVHQATTAIARNSALTSAPTRGPWPSRPMPHGPSPRTARS
ncbi:hypothetical protein ACFVW1_43325 [Streptomyces olivochromogenes]|uniref:hypothetical protein n=1 Tax=Streptomyces olivochromogenes TaxID=1963 RepID=UPI0036DCF119